MIEDLSAQPDDGSINETLSTGFGCSYRGNILLVGGHHICLLNEAMSPRSCYLSLTLGSLIHFNCASDTDSSSLETHQSVVKTSSPEDIVAQLVARNQSASQVADVELELANIDHHQVHLYQALDFEDPATWWHPWQRYCTNMPHRVGNTYPHLGQAWTPTHGRTNRCINAVDVANTTESNGFLRFVTQPYDERTIAEFNKGGGNTNQRLDDRYAAVVDRNGRVSSRGWDGFGTRYLSEGREISYSWRFRVKSDTMLRNRFFTQAVIGQMHVVNSRFYPVCGGSNEWDHAGPAPGVYLAWNEATQKYVLSFKIKQQPAFARYRNSSYTVNDQTYIKDYPCAPDSRYCTITLWDDQDFQLDTWHSIGFTMKLAGIHNRSEDCKNEASCEPSDGHIKLYYNGEQVTGVTHTPATSGVIPPWVEGQKTFEGIQTTFNSCPQYLSLGLYALAYHRGHAYNRLGPADPGFLRLPWSGTYLGGPYTMQDWVVGDWIDDPPGPPPQFIVDYDSVLVFEVTPYEARYDFDTAVAGTTPDTSPNTRAPVAGQIHGAVLSNEGVKGRAMWFDGENDFVELGATESSHPLSLSKGGTLSAWVKIASAKNDYVRVIDRSNAVNAAGGYALIVRPELGQVALGVDTDLWFSAPGVLQQGTWQHLAAVITSQHKRVYINGELVINEASSVLPPASQARTRIGRVGYQGTGYFHGQIDQVRITEQTLNQDDVLDQMRGLIAHYPMREGGGCYIRDVSKNRAPAGVIEACGGTLWPSNDSYTFDGALDVINLGIVGAEDPLQLGEGGTVAFWFRQQASAARYQRIVERASANTGANGYDIYVDPGEAPLQRRVGIAIDKKAWATPWGAYEWDEWTHVAVTMSATDGHRVYVNGTLARLIDSTSLPPRRQTPMLLGGRAASSNGRFKGQLRDVQFYNRPLSAQEVISLHR